MFCYEFMISSEIFFFFKDNFILNCVSKYLVYFIEEFDLMWKVNISRKQKLMKLVIYVESKVVEDSQCRDSVVKFKI